MKDQVARQENSAKITDKQKLTCHSTLFRNLNQANLHAPLSHSKHQREREQHPSTNQFICQVPTIFLNLNPDLDINKSNITMG